jgi:uncharacterized protein YifE (UPF0438 family)
LAHIYQMTSPQHRKYLDKTWTQIAARSLFTDAEAEYLMKYGNWLRALMNDHIQPTTKAQRHFIQVCAGKKAATADYEQLWMRYQLELACQKTKHDLSTNEIAYAVARERISRLAAIGSVAAKNWLEAEGAWEDSPSIGHSWNRVWNVGELHLIGVVFRG